ncbi:hypothetical protein [Vibrio antiquarius]|uniref:hypothetical protein n=1 Tax=Vibrio antiquarius (strain Ex25) TaxID=150340 RepID=UPI002658D3E3|nr:hypothetical protein [Vibrio antiquarius]MCR9366091.1 hypothetical protein [Vibrio antiquarius]
MKPTFWKLSQGAEFFNFSDMLQSIEDRLVYAHKSTGKKGTSSKTQGESFFDAKIGDYFYLTHGNEGIYLIGQFTGPANFFPKNMDDGWCDRPFRLIARATYGETYSGPNKWWAPNHPSTFVRVPDGDLSLFEQEILVPYFDLKLSDYGIHI